MVCAVMWVLAAHALVAPVLSAASRVVSLDPEYAAQLDDLEAVHVDPLGGSEPQSSPSIYQYQKFAAANNQFALASLAAVDGSSLSAYQLLHLTMDPELQSLIRKRGLMGSNLDAVVLSHSCTVYNVKDLVVSLSDLSVSTYSISSGVLAYVHDYDGTPGQAGLSYPAGIVMDSRGGRGIELSIPLTRSAAFSRAEYRTHYQLVGSFRVLQGTDYYHIDTTGEIHSYTLQGRNKWAYTGSMTRVSSPDLGRYQDGIGISFGLDMSARGDALRIPGSPCCSISVGIRNIGYRMVWHDLKVERMSVDTENIKVGPGGALYSTPTMVITESVEDVVETAPLLITMAASCRFDNGISIGIERMPNDLNPEKCTTRGVISYAPPRSAGCRFIYDLDTAAALCEVSVHGVSVGLYADTLDVRNAKLLGMQLAVQLN